MKYIYKIRHKATGKFVRIKLEQQGIDVWASNPLTMQNKNSAMGKVLHDTHKGWSTPPNPSNDEFSKIGCEIVRYEITEIEK